MKAGIDVPRGLRARFYVHIPEEINAGTSRQRRCALVELACALIALTFIRDDSMEQRKR